MQKRIILLVMLSMLIILVSLGIISQLSVNNSIQRSLEKRLMLASIISRYFDHILETNLTRLYDISISGRVDFADQDWEPETLALKTAYEYSIFTDRIFLLDQHGNVVLNYPLQESGKVNLLSIPAVSRIMAEGKPVISDVFTMEPTKKKVILALVPLKDRNGETIGVAGGEINPTNYLFNQMIKSIPTETATCIELIDSQGIIIASNIPKRILTCSDHNQFLGKLIAARKSSVSTCHRCHLEDGSQKRKTQDMLAFSPLSVAPWGISLREPQERVFSPAITLRRNFLTLGIISLGAALVLAMGMSRSIVRPIRLLIQASQRLGRGNLHEPVAITSRDETGVLADSFEVMRQKLAASLERIQKQNLELEQRVLERTEELELSRKKLSSLYHKNISVQEEERKRIARELHDETSQSLNAILISLDTLNMVLGQSDANRTPLEKLRKNVVATLQGIHHLIQDLRPPVLDDLGLESAIRWMLEGHLGAKGIGYFFETRGACPGVSSNGGKGAVDCATLELTLFRVIQEAVINIEKHAEAKHVFVSLIFHDTYVEAEIEDDGRGFDVARVYTKLETGRDTSSFGLLGMKERVALLDGRLTICSRPNEGTHISMTVPF
jgi:signal transduction histidine kinase